MTSRHPALLDDAAYQVLLAGVKAPGATATDATVENVARKDDRLEGDYMLTENNGVTLATSGTALVDFFQELEKSVAVDRLGTLLDQAWKESPLDTLKIIYHARSIPNGKGERESFYRCYGWLAQRHPKTAILNLTELVRPSSIKPSARKAAEAAREAMEEDGFEEVAEELNNFNARSTGYWKDCLNLLVLAANDQLKLDGDFKCIGIAPAIADDTTTVAVPVARRGRGRSAGRGGRRPLSARTSKGASRETREANIAARKVEDAEARANGEDALRALKRLRIERSEEHNTAGHRAALDRRGDARKDTKERVKGKFEGEPFFAALHVTVARSFANQLMVDLETVAAAEKLKSESAETEDWQKAEHSLSMAAKWAPTVDGAHDRQTRVAKSIARILSGDKAGTVQSSTILSVYRTKYLAPLRTRLEIVEKRMSAGEWNKVNYPRVPSIAMSKLSRLFRAKDAERFATYMTKVATGERKIAGAALTPASFVHNARSGFADDVSEAQWRSLVQSIRDEGKLTATAAVVDVSGSMCGPMFSDGTTPIDTALGLGIIIAQVAEEPFKNVFVSFDSVPIFIYLPADGALRDCVDTAISSPWGMSTDFCAALRLLLARAIEHKVPKEQMVERLIVLSDMEFDAADASTSPYGTTRYFNYATANSSPSEPTVPGDLRTHHDVLEAEYRKAGYDLPTLIYWNIAGGRTGMAAKAVKSDTPGTALISGYSAAMLKLFLDGGELPEVEADEMVVVNAEAEQKKAKAVITPESTMRKAIGHASFSLLEIFD